MPRLLPATSPIRDTGRLAFAEHARAEAAEIAHASSSRACGTLVAMGDVVMSKRVLIVDDEADHLETLRRGLLYVGHRCIHAPSAGEALALLTARAEAIDLVLVDVSARGKPGARLIDRIRSARPELPLLVVTGLVVPPLAGLPILEKPFSPDQLARAIAIALTRQER